MFCLLLILLVIFLILKFRKSIIAFFKNKIVMKIIFVIVVVIIGSVVGLKIIRYHYRNRVDEEKCELVENYISEMYNQDCEMFSSQFIFNREGITGGMYIYNFELKLEDGQSIFASYLSYSDLNETTLDKILIK